jgi:predicted O-methyltransferase YrrM
MSTLGKAFYLWRNNATCGVIGKYVTASCARILRKNKHVGHVEALRRFARDNDFKHDWFTANVPYWMDIFQEHGLLDRKIRALEIGSFEGLSACFILQQLPQAELTCVDTWGGSDEHTGLAFDAVERAFDRHVEPWRDRVTKKKMTSLRYLANLEGGEKFDLIYVDGSHHGDDVMVDVVLCFERLKVGGVMILDDYLWRYYPHGAEEPARAINSFLRLCEGRHQLLMAYRQVAIVKTSERSA